MIRVKNVYYMLSYAFRILNEQGYKRIETENFENTADLMAAILQKGLASLLKRGLKRDYIHNNESTSLIRGKIEVTESIKTQTMLKHEMVCSYDEFSTNCKLNQIIKSTVFALIRSDISPQRKKELRKLMMFFQDVDTVDLSSIDWNIQYNRNSQTYRMLISICYFVVKGLLQTNSDGAVLMMDFLDEQRMSKLYEKFILEYYRKEHPEISARASQIPWQLDDGFDIMLPTMQSDIMLSSGEKVLIIDAKYYAHTTQEYFDKHTIHSNNLYQLFTYVKNKEVELSDVEHVVSGMLLYAKTDEQIQPDNAYVMSGNRISVLTLDLDTDFIEIKHELDSIVEEYFG